MNQVYIFDRRQPFNLEIAKPPETQPFSQHGVDSAIELLLFIGISAWAIGEMYAGCSRAVTGAGDGSYDAPDGAREANLVEHRAHFLLRSFRVTQPAGMKNIKVDNDVVIRWNIHDHGKQRPRRRPELAELRVGCEHVKVSPLIIVLSRCAALSIHRQGAKIREFSNPVVPPSQRFKHQFAHGLVSGRESAED